MRNRKPWGSSSCLPLLLLLIFVTLALIPFSALRAQESPAPRAVHLGLVQGDAQERLPGEQALTKALTNSQLQQGVSLITGIGLAEIEFESGTTGYVGDNSALELTELSSSPTGRITRITLTQGIARFYANTRGVDMFAVLASDVAVSPQELADFRVEISRYGTIVRVLEGEVLITGTNMSWTLRKGQTWSMAPGDAEAKITEAPESMGLGYWLPLWYHMPPPYSSWLKTPPYSVPIPYAVPPTYVPYGLQFPHVPAPRSLPRFPQQYPPFPVPPPRFPQ
jgi:hypothetical protein